MNKSCIACASGFSYASHPTEDTKQQDSRRMTINLKNDALWPKSHMSTSCFMVQHMAQNAIGTPLEGFFASKPVLVPVPGKSPHKSGSLWVPQRIAAAMVAENLGRKTVECLKRAYSVPKSSISKDRPIPRVHYDSFYVETLDEADDILLVDDVVTRGSTLLGAANRLASALPNAKIRAFALIRTVSNPNEFKGFTVPCIERIILEGGKAFRRPCKILHF